MNTAIPLHRQQLRAAHGFGRHEENNMDEYSPMYSARDTALPNVRASTTGLQPQTAFRTRACRCIVNSLIATTIIAVSIAFLGSICVGLVLFVQPAPSLVQEQTLITVDTNTAFNDDAIFSLQYISTRNGSIQTSDDVFIMDRNFPTSQPTHVPTIRPTKSPIITKAPLTTAPTVVTNAPSSAATLNTLLTTELRDDKNVTRSPTSTTNTSNANANGSKSSSFTFDDDGKTISYDDPFGNQMEEGSIDDVALQTSATTQETPCTGANCQAFFDDVLNTVLVTDNIDDVVKGKDGIKSSNTDDSLQNVAPGKWPKQANFSQDDGFKNDGTSVDDFWNDVANDDRLKSQSAKGQNLPSLSSVPVGYIDDTQDDALQQNGLNKASDVDDTMKESVDADDLKRVDDDSKTISSFKETDTTVDNFSNSNVGAVSFDPNDNLDDITTTDDFENDNFASHGKKADEGNNSQKSDNSQKSNNSQQSNKKNDLAQGSGTTTADDFTTYKTADTATKNFSFDNGNNISNDDGTSTADDFQLGTDKGNNSQKSNKENDSAQVSGTTTDDDLPTFKKADTGTNDFANDEGNNFSNDDGTSTTDDFQLGLSSIADDMKTFKNADMVTNSFSSDDNTSTGTSTTDNLQLGTKKPDTRTNNFSFDDGNTSTDDFENDNFVTQNKITDEGGGSLQNDDVNDDLAQVANIATAGETTNISNKFATGDDAYDVAASYNVAGTVSSDDISQTTPSTDETASIQNKMRPTSQPSAGKKKTKNAKVDTSTPMRQSDTLGSQQMKPTYPPLAVKKITKGAKGDSSAPTIQAGHPTSKPSNRKKKRSLRQL